jgi:hypothetical protein
MRSGGVVDFAVDLISKHSWWHTLIRSSRCAVKADIVVPGPRPLDVNFFVFATSNPFHSFESPTTRRSILPIRSERRASAALMAAIVCCKVLMFDPSHTIPPSTRAIDPIAAT